LAQNPLVDEPPEPIREHVARHAEVALEVVEAPQAEEPIADPEQGPAVTRDLERRAIEQFCAS